MERLDKERPDFLPQVELFVGTSTGSILAVGLAKGLTPTQLVGMHCEHGKDIFHTNPPHEFVTLGGLIGTKHTTQGWLNVFRIYFDDIKLSQLNCKVLVATFQLDNQNETAPDSDPPRRWQGKFFHNYPNGPFGDQSALDVIMHSSAPPVYFPIYQGFIDEGVIANNPSMCALAQAVSPETGGQDIHDLVLLLIGTGTRPEYMTQTDSNWGVGEWGFKFLDLLFDSGTGLDDFQCQQFLGDCYSRLNVDFADGQDIRLDAADRIGELISIADMCELGPTLKSIDEQWPMPKHEQGLSQSLSEGS